MKNNFFFLSKTTRIRTSVCSVGKCERFIFFLLYERWRFFRMYINVLLLFFHGHIESLYYYVDGHRQTDHKRFSTQYYYYSRPIRNGHAREPVLLIKRITRLYRLWPRFVFWYRLPRDGSGGGRACVGIRPVAHCVPPSSRIEI